MRISFLSGNSQAITTRIKQDKCCWGYTQSTKNIGIADDRGTQKNQRNNGNMAIKPTNNSGMAKSIFI
jgi:hypothetical protein